MLYRICVGDSREALAARSESVAGYDSALVLVKQSAAEFVAGKTELTDVGEYVECSLGLEGFDS